MQLISIFAQRNGGMCGWVLTITDFMPKDDTEFKFKEFCARRLILMFVHHCEVMNKHVVRKPILISLRITIETGSITFTPTDYATQYTHSFTRGPDTMNHICLNCVNHIGVTCMITEAETGKPQSFNPCSSITFSWYLAVSLLQITHKRRPIAHP